MSKRERYKIGKYGVHSQQQGRTFVPFVLDMYGCLAPAALQLIKDIRDESLSSLCGAAHPFRLSRSSFLAELSRTWQFDNARIAVQWMTLVRSSAERLLPSLRLKKRRKTLRAKAPRQGAAQRAAAMTTRVSTRPPGDPPADQRDWLSRRPLELCLWRGLRQATAAPLAQTAAWAAPHAARAAAKAGARTAAPRTAMRAGA